MTTMMALPVDTTPAGSGTIDDLYSRYSCRLLAAAAERLAEIGPVAVELDEDIAQDVWAAVADGHYPDGYRGFAGLDRLLDSAVRKVRVVRMREQAAGIGSPARWNLELEPLDLVDVDVLANIGSPIATPTQPVLPARVSDALAALRALPLAG